MVTEDGIVNFDNFAVVAGGAYFYGTSRHSLACLFKLAAASRNGTVSRY